MQINLDIIAKDCEAKIIYHDDHAHIIIDGVVSDSNNVENGNLFVCLRGNRVDGHDFSHTAFEKGAKAILAEKNPFENDFGNKPPIPVLLVENSQKALEKLANARRKEYAGKVIAITGTAGKTTFKELTAMMLSLDENSLSKQENIVAKNLYNYNTQLGVSLAILGFSGEEKYWVLEIGISKSHDMDELGEILEPDVALILNIGDAHNEGLGDKGTAYHKARIINYLQDSGTALINCDYPDLVEEAKKYKKNIIFFSGNNSKISPYKAEFINLEYHVNNEVRAIYNLQAGVQNFEVKSPLIGQAGAENSIALANLGVFLGINKKVIAHSIEKQVQPKMRFNIFNRKNWTVIDDCYNANPLSNARMLEAAHLHAKDKEFYLVLGEMKELGKIAMQEHVVLGKSIGLINPKAVFWIGDHGNKVCEGLSVNYLGQFHQVLDLEHFSKLIKNDMDKRKDKLILFKGSRANNMEDYLNKFLELCDAI